MANIRTELANAGKRIVNHLGESGEIAKKSDDGYDVDTGEAKQTTTYASVKVSFVESDVAQSDGDLLPRDARLAYISAGAVSVATGDTIVLHDATLRIGKIRKILPASDGSLLYFCEMHG